MIGWLFPSRKGFPRNQKGQVLVELALCGAIYALLIMGTFDASRVLFRLHQLTQVAREGARIASMTAGIDNASGQGVVDGRINQILTKMNLLNSPGLLVSITPVVVTSDDGVETKLVEVQLSQNVASIIGGASLIPGLASQTISVTIAMPQFV